MQRRSCFGQLLGRAASFALLAVGVGCGGKATTSECQEMLDKYLDMVMSAEPGLAELPPAEAAAAREMKKAMRKAEPGYRRVETQCTNEVTRREYRCAMKAPNPETWQACID